MNICGKDLTKMIW